MNDNVENFAFDTALKNIITTNLIFLRKKHKFTSEELAKVLNLSRQSYSAYELGTRDISIASLKRLATFYNVSLDALTSTSLTETFYQTTSFYEIEKRNGKYCYKDELCHLSNYAFSIIVVKVNDLKVKLFETNNAYISNHELLFEINKNIHLGKVTLFEDGSGIFIEDEIITKFTKKEASSLVFIGMLLATIHKEYEKREFF